MASRPNPRRTRGFRLARVSRPALTALTVAIGLVGPASVGAQTAVNPLPILSTGSLTREPRLSGYVSARETIRDDTMTFIINRARMTVVAAPASFIAVRLQADFATLGRTRGDTVPASLITDAYIQLAPTDTASRLVQMLRPVLLLGQFKAPFSLEYLTSSTSVITADRSMAADRLAIKRDRGVQGTIRFPRFATVSAALMDGEGSNRVTNPDGRQMAIGRLTLIPLPWMSVSGKWASQGSDNRWGYDARFSRGAAVVEGEVIQRDGPASPTTHTDAGAGYVLAAYRIRPWIQPVVKWERLNETTTGATSSTTSRATWTTYGVTLFAPDDRFRAQFNWSDREERPVTRKGELIAQFQAMF